MTNDRKYKGENYSGPARSSPYPLSRLSPAVELVELAREVANADDMLSVQATAQLRLLAQQMELLREKARDILAETKQHQELHRAQCAFRKIPGHLYHLYRKKDGELIFSLIGHDEWGGSPARSGWAFVGSYRLENDMTWSPQQP